MRSMGRTWLALSWAVRSFVVIILCSRQDPKLVKEQTKRRVKGFRTSERRTQTLEAFAVRMRMKIHSTNTHETFGQGTARLAFAHTSVTSMIQFETEGKVRSRGDNLAVSPVPFRSPGMRSHPFVLVPDALCHECRCRLRFDGRRACRFERV